MPSVKRSPRRAALRIALADAMRRFSTATVLMHAAIAERLGLNATDHKAADLLMQRGPMTAGELAQCTGLTTGAVTGIIDRLEAAGWVRRERDPADRRRVIVTLVLSGARLRGVERVFEPLARAFEDAIRGYSEAELATLVNFLAGGPPLMEAQVRRLRAGE